MICIMNGLHFECDISEPATKILLSDIILEMED